MAKRNDPSPMPEKIGSLLQESRWLGVGALALFLITALWGFHRGDPGWSHAATGGDLQNPAGKAGAWIADLLLYLFGLSAWWWIVLLGMFVWWGVRKLNADRGELRVAIGAAATLRELRFSPAAKASGSSWA